MSKEYTLEKLKELEEAIDNITPSMILALKEMVALLKKDDVEVDYGEQADAIFKAERVIVKAEDIYSHLAQKEK